MAVPPPPPPGVPLSRPVLSDAKKMITIMQRNDNNNNNIDNKNDSDNDSDKDNDNDNNNDNDNDTFYLSQGSIFIYISQ